MWRRARSCISPASSPWLWSWDRAENPVPQKYVIHADRTRSTADLLRGRRYGSGGVVLPLRRGRRERDHEEVLLRLPEPHGRRHGADQLLRLPALRPHGVGAA